MSILLIKSEWTKDFLTTIDEFIPVSVPYWSTSCVFQISMISSKRQVGHVETITSALANRWIKLSEMSQRI